MTGTAPERPLRTLADDERLARERLAPDVWDWIAGGAGEERTLAANTEAFDHLRLLPRMLTGAQAPDPATKVFGTPWSAPVGVAPMAYHTLADPAGELATVRAAGDVGLPVVVSTFAGRTFEELAAEARAPLWLQTYCFRDRSVTRDLVARAEAAGFEALMLTADAPRLGRRLRDLRNGFRLPPGIVPANLPEADYSSPGAHAATEFDPALDWTVVDWLRSITRLPVLVKGLLAPGDALRALDAGADGIVVSNHGGRQLDGVPAAIEALPPIADAVAGRCALLLDGGVRRATDVLAALASGADAVLTGRPVLYGLAVDGEAGVRHVLWTLCDDLRDAMALAGAATVADVDAGLLAPPSHRRPVRGADTRPPSPRLPSPPVGRMRKEDLHASLADPVLDAMTFLNEITARYPDAVSFAPGRPFEGFFSVEDVHGHLDRYLDHLSGQGRTPGEIRTFLYQYGAAAGQIRDVVADSLRADEGIGVAPEAVVVTAGCQEAMLITLRALFRDRDDVLLVSTPAYVGITGAARLLDIPVTGIEEDPVTGLSCAAVEAAVHAERARGRRPRALYVVPDHSNPSGKTIDAPTRRELLALAQRLDLLVLEDSPYRGVSPGERVPTLKALDRDRRVVHLGSYAKTAFPGARVGFAVADQTVVSVDGTTTLLADELAKVKSMVTVNTSTLSQAVVAGMLLAADGELSKANAPAARHYGDALRTLLSSLEEHFPADRRSAHRVHWNAPTGGFFLAVHVPFTADEQALARSAQDFGVIWTPMAYFHPADGGEHTMRLSFSLLAPDDIRAGVRRLAAFIAAETARTPA